MDYHVFTQSASGVKYYVDNSAGLDSNPGTQANPFKTIAKGYSALRDGFDDWLLLKCGGTWEENTTMFWSKSGGTNGGSGAPKHMVLGSYGTGARPIVNVSPGAYTVSMSFFRRDWLAVIGIQFGNRYSIVDSTNYDAVDVALSFRDDSGYGCKNNIVEDCHFVGQRAIGDAQGDGVRQILLNRNIFQPRRAHLYIGFGADQITMDQNIVQVTGAEQTAQNSIYDHCVYCGEEAGEDLTFIGNIFDNAPSHGIQARSGGKIVGNVFTRCKVGISVGEFAGGGYRPSGVNAIIQNNLLTDFIDYTDPVAAVMPRGWGLYLMHIKSADVTGNYIVGSQLCTGGRPVAFRGDFSPAGFKNVGIHALNFQNNVIANWKGESIDFPLVSIEASGEGSGLFQVSDLNGRGNVIVAQSDYPGYLVDVKYAQASPSGELRFAGNKYDHKNSGSFPTNVFRAPALTPCALAAFKTFTVDSTSTGTAVTFVASTRTVAKYNLSLGGSETLDDFYAKAIADMRNPVAGGGATNTGDWWASEVYDYMKAGYTPA